MSALARYFKHIGKSVSGYDRANNDMTKMLESEGIPVHNAPDIDTLKTFKVQDTLVIYTPAIPSNFEELNHVFEAGYTVVKRAEALGLISDTKHTIAVGGTHGKTTTSCLLSHIYKASGEEVNAFLGGISSNYETNMLIGSSNTLVVEADEYDRSFLHLFPNTALITSVEPDHLDIYGESDALNKSFQEFMSHVPMDGHLVLNSSVEYSGDMLVHTYGLNDRADLYAANIRIEEGFYVFDLRGMAEEDNIVLGMPGIHNVENAVGATLVALMNGLSISDIKRALRTFAGVKRRFEYRVRNENVVYIDDYAHHPTELERCITSVKQLYPGKRITGVFQPHLYSRTRDFADGFANSLGMLNELVLLDIYPAREKPIRGITSQWLLDKVKLTKKWLVAKDDAVGAVADLKPEILLTLGAGDIDQLVEPLTNALN